MVRVWRADVNRIDGRIPKQGLIIRGGVLDAESIGERVRFLEAAAGHRGDFNKPEPSNRFEVHAPHETGSNDCSPQAGSAHQAPQRIAETPLTGRSARIPAPPAITG